MLKGDYAEISELAVNRLAAIGYRCQVKFINWRKNGKPHKDPKEV